MPTTRVPRDFKEFLKPVDAHSARFLLVAGYAVNAFSQVRNTVDMDLYRLRRGDCLPRRVTIDDDGLQIPAISLQDLKRNKLASDRKKDLPDLEELP